MVLAKKHILYPGFIVVTANANSGAGRARPCTATAVSELGSPETGPLCGDHVLLRATDRFPFPLCQKATLDDARGGRAIYGNP